MSPDNRPDFQNTSPMHLEQGASNTASIFLVHSSCSAVLFCFGSSPQYRLLGNDHGQLGIFRGRNLPGLVGAMTFGPILNKCLEHGVLGNNYWFRAWYKCLPHRPEVTTCLMTARRAEPCQNRIYLLLTTDTSLVRDLE